MVFMLQFAKMGHHMNWFVYIKESLHPWDKSHFIMQGFRSVQSLSCVLLFATPWTAARQASLSITNSWSPPKPMSIESVMPSNHLILCHPLFLLPLIFPSIRVFSNESALCIRWPKYWSFSFNISPSNEHPARFIILLMCCWIRCVSILLRIFLGHGSNLNFHQQRNG